VWGDRLVWGDNTNSIVWGDRLVWGERLVWGDRLVRDEGTWTVLNGDRLVWGDTSPNVNDLRIVWGDLEQVTGLQSLVAWSPGVPDAPYTSADPY
ncbi:MAG TPA: hypothetical protein VHK24_09390, partial [Steroidobacter sp.]|nr:hypothetical protein [Steroidobacter sp.]